MPFSRPNQFQLILSRLRSPRRFIQVLAGPRQSGKTTLATQALKALEMTSHYASADEPSLKDNAWVEAQWDIARIRSSAGRRRSTLLVLDEVQKIPGWSEVVKRLWDEDSRARRPVKVLLLGSSPLMMQSGLTESLAGTVRAHSRPALVLRGDAGRLRMGLESVPLFWRISGRRCFGAPTAAMEALHRR